MFEFNDLIMFLDIHILLFTCVMIPFPIQDRVTFPVG